MDIELYKIIITAIIVTTITQFAILLVGWLKVRQDLRSKKKLINLDIKRILKILPKMKDEYNSLHKQFTNNTTQQAVLSLYEHLYTDNFDSISKQDLFKIYKSKMHTVIEVYKSVLFLKQFAPDIIYSDYIKRSEEHRLSREHEGHTIQCNVETFLITQVKWNCNNNAKFIDSLIPEMRQVRNLKFFVLSPF